MTRVRIAVVVGLLLTSVALPRPHMGIVRAVHPDAAAAARGAEDWWLLVREGDRWIRWDGPYATEFACIDDGKEWQRANPHKIFTCAAPADPDHRDLPRSP